MGKYKVGQKFIIEIDSHMTNKHGELYGIKGFKTLVFDDNGLDRLKQRIGMTLSDAYDVGFEKGLEEGRNEKDCKACMDADAKANADYNSGYEDGLRDAWECAKKIANFNAGEIHAWFGVRCIAEVFDEFSASEAENSMIAYKDKQSEIKVGDIVSYDKCDGIITSIKGNRMYVMWKDGSAGEWVNAGKWFKKTGRHYDIDSILEQLKGADDDN